MWNESGVSIATLGIGSHRSSGEKPLGIAEISVQKIENIGLKCESAPESNPVHFPEHGVIVGWDPTQKEKRIELQQHLAACCGPVSRQS